MMIGAAALSASCEEQEDVLDSTPKKEMNVNVSVYNASSWTPENPTLDLVEGASVYVANDSLSFTNITNSEGIAKFENLALGTYHVKVSHEDMGNLVDTETSNGIALGYLIDGVFRTQTEIDNSAQQDAEVGGFKFMDANGDGTITSYDKVGGKLITIEIPYFDLNADGKIDEEDKENGQYKLDNTKDIDIEVLIGK